MGDCSKDQILFLRKNHIDLDKPNIIITVTDNVAFNNGQSSVDFVRNRNNVSGWVTTESNDTANTEFLVEMGDLLPVDWIQIIKHNFKDYTVEYRDVSDNWILVQAVTNDTKSTTIFEFDKVQADAIRITIQGTQIPDADKEMRQLIIAEKFGRFDGYPVIKKPVHSSNKKKNKMLSGKLNIVGTRGAFSTELEIRLSTNDIDLSLHEDLYYQIEGVHVLLSGGNEDQFATKRRGYRNEDIFLVKPSDEYSNPYQKGVYLNGIQVRMKLSEVSF